jgi:hypothetical protein
LDNAFSHLAFFNLLNAFPKKYHHTAQAIAQGIHHQNHHATHQYTPNDFNISPT